MTDDKFMKFLGVDKEASKLYSEGKIPYLQICDTCDGQKIINGSMCRNCEGKGSYWVESK